MNKENPKVSIIVPMFNCAAYAPQCIESIINQTYANWELWLVHGDSNDGTEAVCQAYEDKDSERIHNIYHIDGLVPARNVGYEHATGDWIMYLDGDDWIDTNCLEEALDAAKRYDYPEVIFWNFIQMLDDKPIEGKSKWICEDPEHLYQGDECLMLAKNVLIYKSGINEAYAKLVQRDYCLKYGLDHNHNLRQGLEGSEYAIRVMAYAKKALFLKKNYNYYRFNPTSLSKVVSEKNAIWIHDGLVEIDKFIKTQLPQRKDEFLQALYQRTLYVVIAVAMSTYFNDKNKESYFSKKKKFKEAIKNWGIFREALKKGDISELDSKRKLMITMIKHNIYFELPLISKLKAYLLKKGNFNY